MKRGGAARERRVDVRSCGCAACRDADRRPSAAVIVGLSFQEQRSTFPRRFPLSLVQEPAMGRRKIAIEPIKASAPPGRSAKTKCANYGVCA